MCSDPHDASDPCTPFRTLAQLQANSETSGKDKEKLEAIRRCSAFEAHCLSCLTYDLLSQELEEHVRLERCVKHYLECLERQDVRILTSPAPGEEPRVISLYIFYYVTVSYFLSHVKPLRSGESISKRVETYFEYCSAAIRAKRWTLSRMV